MFRGIVNGTSIKLLSLKRNSFMDICKLIKYISPERHELLQMPPPNGQVESDPYFTCHINFLSMGA